MTTADRRTRLVAAAEDRGYVRVVDLADEFRVSEMTIRRDLEALSQQGALRRVRGGAMANRADNVAQIDQSPTAESDAVPCTVGLVVPYAGHYHSSPGPEVGYYFRQVLESAQAELSRRGARGRLARSAARTLEDNAAADRSVRQQEQQAAHQLLDEGAVGLLFTPNARNDAAGYREWLEELDIPVVLMERGIGDVVSGAPISSVRTLHRRGVQLAIEHLRRAGHRRIGLLGYHHSQTATDIVASWKSVSPTFGLDLAQSWSVTDYPAWPDPAAIDGWLDEVAARGITGLLIHNDNNTYDVLDRVAARGLDVPTDLSVISYDDDIAGLLTPPITAVAPPKREIGRIAASLLLDQVSREDAVTTDILVHPRLVPRASVQPPRDAR